MPQILYTIYNAIPIELVLASNIVIASYKKCVALSIVSGHLFAFFLIVHHIIARP